MSTVIGKIDISAFDGDGLLIEGTDGSDVLRGTNASDLILGKAGDDVIFGKGGDDQIAAGADNDRVFGGFGNDIIEAGSGNDTVFGGFGDDCINAGSGDDEIFGGFGNDTIGGGAGSDLMFGGQGEDVFEFNAEDFGPEDIDTIVDFQTGQDKIVINGLGEDDVIAFDAQTNSVLLNGSSIINLPSGGGFSSPTVQEQDDEDGGYEIV